MQYYAVSDDPVSVLVSSKQQASQVSAALTSPNSTARAAGTAMPAMPSLRESGSTKLRQSGAAQTCGAQIWQGGFHGVAPRVIIYRYL